VKILDRRLLQAKCCIYRAPLSLGCASFFFMDRHIICKQTITVVEVTLKICSLLVYM